MDEGKVRQLGGYIQREAMRCNPAGDSNPDRGDFFVDGYCDVSDEDPDGTGVFSRDRTCSLNGNIMNIVVTVQWDEGGDTKEVRLETVLTNWQ